MAKTRGSDFDLSLAMRDPGFTPRVGDAGALLDRIALGGDPEADAERALLRIGPAALRAALDREARDPAARARILRFLGRLGAETADPAALGVLTARLADEDERVRRAAANALGKARPPGAAEALAAALARE